MATNHTEGVRLQGPSGSVALLQSVWTSSETYAHLHTAASLYRAVIPLSMVQHLLLGAVLGCVFSILRLRLAGPKAPLVGVRFFFEPRFVANFRFFRDAKAVLDEGWSKFPEQPHWFARNDADMMLVPHKHIDEIRALPITIANPTEAHAHNLLGHLTGTDLILRSNLHFRVIQSRLTPNLALMAERLKEELDFALAEHFPIQSHDWTVIEPYHEILNLVARMSAAAFVGKPMCRQEKWLEITTQYTENVFLSLLALRVLPTWMHRSVYLFLPTIWKNAWYISQAKAILTPEIKRQQARIASGKGIDRPSLLSWITDCAIGSEQDPAYLAHLQVIISLASIHTTQMNAVHCLYDLAAHPEYVQPLRDEIAEAGKGGWSKASLTKLRKLDSFMKESQRLSPPSFLSYHRVMKQNHVLSDGTVLPRGGHICMPVKHIQDALCPGSAEEYDPMRYERLREEESHAQRHQFTSATRDQLNFGYGKYACPGRFFAAVEIKTILVPLIMNYDFRLQDGEGRPANLQAYEFIFPNPHGKLLARQRPPQERMRF